MGNIFFKTSLKDTKNNACIAVGVDGMLKKRKLNIASNDEDTSDDDNDSTTIKSKKFKYSNVTKETRSRNNAQTGSGKFSFLNRIFKRKSLSFTGQSAASASTSSSLFNDDAFKDDGSLIDSFLNLNNNNSITHHVDSKINSFSSLVLHAASSSSSSSSSLSSSSNGNLLLYIYLKGSVFFKRILF